jgi:hypothetical protein
MKTCTSILIAGLVVLAFAAGTLAQTPTPASPPAPSTGGSGDKTPTKSDKKTGKSKQAHKRSKKARAPEMSTKKTQ